VRGKAGGFFIERLSLTGAHRPVAAVAFADGLNVVAGASDTGKSYLCDLIDFSFGGSTLRTIEHAQGYDRVALALRTRGSEEGLVMERALAGGNVLVRRYGSGGAVLEERFAAAKHNADDSTTLSALLLQLSGFKDVRVRKNKGNETRSLSFRDVAFLTVVDETRIISESAPHLSGSPTEKTVEGEVFRLMVTGQQASVPIAAPKKALVQGAKAQLEVVGQLASQLEAELAALQLGTVDLTEELARLDEARGLLLQSYETSRVEIGGLERELAERARALRQIESRVAVIDGLTRRFELLDRHYESDIERLNAVRQAGSMLEALPAEACPWCGAAPELHRPDDAAVHLRLADVRSAAEWEREKVEALRTDLHTAIIELEREAEELNKRRTSVRDDVTRIQRTIAAELSPRARTSAAQLQQQVARRDLVLRGRALTEQLKELESRASKLEAVGKRSAKVAAPAEGPTTAVMETFAKQVEDVLSAWRFPETGRVVFSEDAQDLVIGGQPRASHGKGVRALTCSAFIAGLMRHCVQRGLPHPGLVVLDSPLVAYKDPDKPGTESARLRQAGVKDAFFRALADGLCLGQVIVFENEDPPPDVAARITHHHFTKSASGRYGLFPAGGARGA
jgi:hypothetical protein